MITPPRRWFKDIQRDLGTIPDALEWYFTKLAEGHNEVNISGTLIRVNQNQPGLVAYYDAMHTDLDMILEFIERKHRIAKAKKLRELADAPPTNSKLSATDLKLLAETDDDVMSLEQLAQEIRYVYKQFSSLMKAFEQRGYTLNNITKIRVAGLEEVNVD